MRILGIDPGKSTGYGSISVVERKISLGEFGVTKDMTLVEIAPHIEAADIVVYEGFWIRPDLAQKGNFNWQSLPAEQVIGALLTLCKLYRKEAVKQQPSQRVPGYSFAGMTYKKGKKGTHWQDAMAHAVFYAVQKLHASPVGA